MYIYLYGCFQMSCQSCCTSSCCLCNINSQNECHVTGQVTRCVSREWQETRTLFPTATRTALTLLSMAQGSSIADFSTSTSSISPDHQSRRLYPSSMSRLPTTARGRGRSNVATYERLEDLLREAGYKETRIFTPEAERTYSSAEQSSN